MLGPLIVSCPAGVAFTFAVIPAAFSAFCRSAAYDATDAPAAMMGALMVVEMPPAFGPVMIRFVAGLTVASVPALEPKVKSTVFVPAALPLVAASLSGRVTL